MKENSKFRLALQSQMRVFLLKNIWESSSIMKILNFSEKLSYKLKTYDDF